MTIFGPFAPPRTSAVTEDLARPVEVTFSPSTTRTTGSVTDSPTPVAIWSISMTSPTATFCCVLPAFTIAYTAVSFILQTLSLGSRHATPPLRFGVGCRRSVLVERVVNTEGQYYGSPVTRAKRGVTGARSPLARALLLDRHVLDVLVVAGRLRAVRRRRRYGVRAGVDHR